MANYLPQFLTNISIYKVYPFESEQGRTWKKRTDSLEAVQLTHVNRRLREDEKRGVIRFCLTFPFLNFRIEMGSGGTGKYAAKYGTGHFTSVELISYAVFSCSGSVIFGCPLEQQKGRKKIHVRGTDKHIRHSRNHVS